MDSNLERGARRGRALVMLAAVVVMIGGCAHGRIQEYADRVEARYIGEPAARAVNELGAPVQDRPAADLRTYIWETGSPGTLGGNCRLVLVADRQGTVVDYAIYGTPLGCRRLLNVS